MEDSTHMRSGNWSVFLVILATLLTPACGGSDDGPPAVLAPPKCIDFVAAGNPTNATVVMNKNGGAVCERLAVQLDVTGVNDVFAADFSVSFDPNLFSYDGHDKSGSFLSSDGATVQVLETTQNGEALVAISRFAVTTGINVTSTRPLITLFFRHRGASGSGTLSFSRSILLDSQASPTAIPGVQWTGGTFSID